MFHFPTLNRWIHWFDKQSTRVTTVIIYLALFLSGCFNIGYYWYYYQPQFIELSLNTPFSLTFHGPSAIYVNMACVGSLATGVAMGLDLLLDYRLGWHSIVNDQFERAFTLGVLAIPAICLLHSSSWPETMPGMFAITHAIQMHCW